MPLTDKIELKRELGPLEVTLSGVGIILGAGIYALIGEASNLAGNALWISFGLSALVALFTGLSYAELSSMFPKASAEHEYTTQAFGRAPAFIIGWLIILSGTIGAATVSLGFSGYFTALTGLPAVPSALALIAVLSAVLFVGIKESAWLAVIFTLIEAGGLILIIYIGLPYLGSVDYMEMPHGLKGVFEASALIFFAYQGFEEMVKLSEETKDPVKTVPRGLIYALFICIVLYMMVALSAVSVMGWQGLGGSKAPFADIAYVSLGKDAFVLLSMIALFATTNTVLLMLLAASRIAYGMAASSDLPEILARVHPSRRTPWVAIVAVALFASFFVFFEEIDLVANVTNFTLFITFVVINGALIALRYRLPDIPRPFRVPGSLKGVPVFPVMGIISCIFMLSHLEGQVMAIGTALTAAGALIYLAVGARR